MLELAVSLLRRTIRGPKPLIQQAGRHWRSTGNRYVPGKSVTDRSDAALGIDGIPGRRALTVTINCAADGEYSRPSRSW
jgi:hypothetical protein